MAGISKRVFGADLHPKIRQKLELRQAFAEQANPGDSIEINKELFDNEGTPIGDYDTNFGGIADLSSRTPIARLWTAVQIHRHTETGRFHKDSPLAKTPRHDGNDKYLFIKFSIVFTFKKGLQPLTITTYS